MKNQNTKKFTEQEYKKTVRKFNKYIGIRYSLALFLFSNLYLALSYLSIKSIMIIVPITLMAVASIAFFEQARLFQNKNKIINLKWTKIFFKMQAAANILLIGYYTFNLFDGDAKIYLVLIGIAVIGILLCTYVLNKIKKDETNGKDI